MSAELRELDLALGIIMDDAIYGPDECPDHGNTPLRVMSKYSLWACQCGAIMSPKPISTSRRWSSDPEAVGVMMEHLRVAVRQFRERVDLRAVQRSCLNVRTGLLRSGCCAVNRVSIFVQLRRGRVRQHRADQFLALFRHWQFQTFARGLDAHRDAEFAGGFERVDLAVEIRGLGRAHTNPRLRATVERIRDHRFVHARVQNIRGPLASVFEHDAFLAINKNNRTKRTMKKLINKIMGALRRAFSPSPIIALGNTTANSSGYRTCQATAVAIVMGKRVKYASTGLISVAAAAEGAIGVTVEDIPASGYGTVKLFNAGGTFIIYANAAIAAGAQLYPTAGGGVDDAGTTALPLVALEAATAQGDLIECGPLLLGA